MCVCTCVWHDIDPNDWLNKLYNFYMTAIVSIISWHGLEFKCVIETRVSWHYSILIPFVVGKN